MIGGFLLILFLGGCAHSIDNYSPEETNVSSGFSANQKVSDSTDSSLRNEEVENDEMEIFEKLYGSWTSNEKDGFLEIEVDWGTISSDDQEYELYYKDLVESISQTENIELFIDKEGIIVNGTIHPLKEIEMIYIQDYAQGKALVYLNDKGELEYKRVAYANQEVLEMNLGEDKIAVIGERIYYVLQTDRVPVFYEIFKVN